MRKKKIKNDDNLKIQSKGTWNMNTSYIHFLRTITMLTLHNILKQESLVSICVANLSHEKQLTCPRQTDVHKINTAISSPKADSLAGITYSSTW